MYLFYSWSPHPLHHPSLDWVVSALMMKEMFGIKRASLEISCVKMFIFRRKIIFMIGVMYYGAGCVCTLVCDEDQSHKTCVRKLMKYFEH